MTEERNCVRCGRRIPEGSEYCPACGAAPDGSAYDPRRDEVPVMRRDYVKRPDTLGVFPDIMLAYGVVATVAGILLLVAFLRTDSIWEGIVDSDGLYMGMTLSQFEMATASAGIVFLVSGVLAVVSSRMAKNRDRFNVCIALSTVSSVVLLALGVSDLMLLPLGAVLCAIGILMTYRVYVNSDSFEC